VENYLLGPKRKKKGLKANHGDKSDYKKLVVMLLPASTRKGKSKLGCKKVKA